MVRPRNWWIGLLPLALLWLWVAGSQTGRLEQDITARTVPAIAKARALVDQARVSVQGRDITVAGTVLKHSARAEIERLKDVPGVRKANVSLAPLARFSPFRLSAERAGSKITLQGHVSDPALRDVLVAAARQAAGTEAMVVDELQYGSGAPAGFKAAALHGLSRLAALKDGKFALSDAQYSLSGTAGSSADYTALLAATGSLPAGIKPGVIRIIAPPATGYRFAATRSGNTIKLEGFVPDLKTRESLAARARSVAGANGRIEDKLQYASGAPAGFEANAGTTVARLGDLQSGSIALSGATVAIKGIAATSERFAVLTGANAGLPAGLKAGSVAVAAPAISPYSFIAEKQGGNLQLRGHVSDPAMRAKLLEAARKAVALGNGTVEDKLAYASGAPGGFEAQALYAIAVAAQLKRGSFNLQDNVASLSGEAQNSASYDALRGALQDLPAGARAGQLALAPPVSQSYSFFVARDGDKITLSGSTPTPEMRTELKALAGVLPGVKSVDDRLTYASGAPDKFSTIAWTGIYVAGRLNSGRFSYVNGKVGLSGEAPDSQAYVDATRVLGGLPGGLGGGKAEIMPPAAKIYTFSVTQTADRLVMTGQTPSVAVREALNAAARKRAGGRNIEDRLSFASGAPANFRQLAEYGIELAVQLKSGSFSLRGNGASLSGDAPSSAVYAGLLDAMEKLPGGGRKVLVDVLPPAADPYSFSARRNGETVTLSGHVPSPDLRERLSSAVSAAGRKLKDELVYASSAGPDFENAAIRGIQLAAGVKDGDFRLTGNTFTFSGEALDRHGYDQARQILANFPRKIRPGSVNVLPPVARPYDWSVVRKGDSIELAGNVPNETMRAELERQARQLFPGLTVTNTMRVSRGAPAGDYAAMMKFALDQAARLRDGSLLIRDGRLSIKGNARDKAGAELLRDLKKAKVPRSMHVQDLDVLAPLPGRISVALPPKTEIFVPVDSQSARGASGAGKQIAVELPPVADKPQTVPEKPAPVRGGAGSKPEDTARQAKGETERNSAAASAECGTPEAPVPVYFPSGKTVLRNVSRRPLAEVTARAVARAKKCPAMKILLRGHADFNGTRKDNVWLGTQRTFVIKRHLIRAGIQRSQIETVSYGEDRPAADNRQFLGRARNRRVEIILQ
jgi:OOP family OmpA-OmpF porin